MGDDEIVSLSDWYEKMSSSDYWVGNYMWNAFTNIFNMVPILINSVTSRIDCGLFNIPKYETIIIRDDDRIHTINDLQKLKEDTDTKFILISYESMIHYKNIHVEINDREKKFLIA